MSRISTRFVICNGELIPPGAATVSVLGSTLYGAFGVYESIQLWNGVVFHLDDHLSRLLASAAAIGLPLSGDLAAHRDWVHQLVQAEGGPLDATIRLFAVGPEADAPPRSFLWLEPLYPPSPQMIRDGVGAVCYSGERALPTVKSLNTLVNTLARQADIITRFLQADMPANVRTDLTARMKSLDGVLMDLKKVAALHREEDRRDDAMPAESELPP